MRRFILALFLVFAFFPSALAWGPKANDLFCRQTVVGVWGENALACLDDQTQYCTELISAINASVGRQCLDAIRAGAQITPSNAPRELFQDPSKLYNYDDCPLVWIRPNNEWICSGKGNPARDEALKWFALAKESKDTCMQVRLFCTGATYYASSFFPLNRVKYLQGCVNGPLQDLVDDKITSGESNWTVSESCDFAYMKEMAGVSRLTSQHLTFVVDENDFNAVEANLTSAAAYVFNDSLHVPSTTQTTATTTTITFNFVTSTISTTSTTMATTSTTIPVVTTSIEETTTTVPVVSPTLTTATSTSTTTSTTAVEAPTSTTLPPPQPPLMDNKVNKSIGEIESMLNKVQPTVDASTSNEPMPYSNIVLIVVLGAIVLAAVVLLTYVVTVLRRPTIHPSRKVVLPPSIRRRIRKPK
jgi:hypothetical protein